MKSVTFVHGRVKMTGSSSDDDNYGRRREFKIAKYAFTITCG